MNLVVSNSSPLINLARIAHFDWLQKFYGEVIIPPAVYEEVVTRGHEQDGSKDVRESQWVRQVAPQDALAVEALAAELDRGEASAIILSRELGVQFLLIDEIRGRRIARRLGISVIGTIGILTRAKREGLLPNVKDELDKLRLRGTWIADHLYYETLQVVGESPQAPAS